MFLFFSAQVNMIECFIQGHHKAIRKQKFKSDRVARVHQKSGDPQQFDRFIA